MGRGIATTDHAVPQLKAHIGGCGYPRADHRDDMERHETAPLRRGGHGIVGMAERATLLGGSLTARPHGSVFRVEARLPASGRRP